MKRAIVALCVAGSAAAADYPSKPIRLVVPFPPGAGTDAVARVVAQRLGDALAQPFVVDNRTGAGGAIGAQSVARAEPDGYTLLFIASPFTTVAAASARAGYDPLADFASVALVAVGPLALAATPAIGSLAELLALARARPGTIHYGSAGPGSVNHLALELLNRSASVAIVHVPYKGIGPAIADLLGGQIQTLTATIPAVLPHQRAGKLRVLAVTGAKRNPLVPDAPAMIEAGVRDYEVINYWGIVAPARTPGAVVAKLNAEVQRVLAIGEVRARLEGEGVELLPGGPEALRALLERDLRKWRTLIVEAGLRLE